MEIIAQSVAVVVVAHCGRGIDRRMEWGLGRRAGPGRKEGQAASLLARKGGATTTSELTLNCRNCGEKYEWREAIIRRNTHNFVL